MVCGILNIDSFDEAAMDAAMDYATVDHETVTFHFRDDHTEVRTYKKRKRGTRNTEEYKAYMSEVMKKQKGTPENRKACSERMKKLRSEKYWNSRKK